MIHVQSCPRCSGRIAIEELPHREFDIVCISCGWRIYLPSKNNAASINERKEKALHAETHQRATQPHHAECAPEQQAHSMPFQETHYHS